MTHQELSQEEYRLSRIIITTKEDFNHKHQPFETDLAAYYQKLFQLESITTHAPKETAHIPTLEELRYKALNDALKKLSSLQVDGKEHIEEYLRHQYRCFFQSATIRGSYNALSYFVKFISESGRHSIKDIERADLESYVEHEQDRGMRLSTVKLRLGIVKAFLRFIIDRGIVDESVFPWKLKIKTLEPLPRAMDPEDVDRLLAVNASTRDRAMILLLLRTGMRIGELLRIRVSDVNMAEQKILIDEGEKNQRGRVVYFSDDARTAVSAWMKERKQGMELLFYGPKGKVLSYPAARMMFGKYLDQAGLSHKDYTLHCLRHTYATDLINARMPLECLEKLLGHSRLDVTRRYAMLTDKTREQEYFKAMAVIERREKDEHYGCDRELQTLLEPAQRLPSHSEELYEHP